MHCVVDKEDSHDVCSHCQPNSSLCLILERWVDILTKNMSLARYMLHHSDASKRSTWLPGLSLADEKREVLHVLANNTKCSITHKPVAHNMSSFGVDRMYWEHYFEEGKHEVSGEAVLSDWCRNNNHNYDAAKSEMFFHVHHLNIYPSKTFFFKNNPDVMQPSTLIPDHWTLADDKVALSGIIKRQLLMKLNYAVDQSWVAVNWVGKLEKKICTWHARAQCPCCPSTAVLLPWMENMGLH